MITRLARLELAGPFFELCAKNRIRDRLSDIQFVERRMLHRRRLRYGPLKFIEPVVDLFNGRKQRCKIVGGGFF